MPKSKSLTIIDTKKMRGVVAPPELLSKKTLTDLVDFLELSSPASVRETKKLIAESDRDSSWVSLRDIQKELDAA